MRIKLKQILRSFDHIPAPYENRRPRVAGPVWLVGCDGEKTTEAYLGFLKCPLWFFAMNCLVRTEQEIKFGIILRLYQGCMHYHFRIEAQLLRGTLKLILP